MGIVISLTAEEACQWVKCGWFSHALAREELAGLISTLQLATCHKAIVVSGSRVHFGCLGDKSPSSRQSKQWEPLTAVLSLLGLNSVACPLYYLDRISFYTFHPPQDNTCGFRKAITIDGDCNFING